MPRSHGRVMASIWTDSDFISLPVAPQRLYLFLLSQPDLSHAGLLPLRMRRWASKVAGETEQAIAETLAVLVAGRFVLVDYDTEELVVRTFVRNDGVYRQPKVMLRMREDARQIESPHLRRAFLAELDRLPISELSDKPAGQRGDQPSTRQTVVAVLDTLREDFRMPSLGVSDTPTDTPREGLPIPPRVRAGALPLPPTPYPLPPATVSPSASGDAAAPAESAQTLIAEWIDHCGPDATPPKAVTGQIAKQIKALLSEGIPYNHVREGLIVWHGKSLHPSTLPSIVHEVRIGPAKSTPRLSRSTTDERVAQTMALLPRMAELDAADEAAARLRSLT